ncbi:GDSL esterase/lipase At1g31550-like [Bidens hawaiensis]|uniref:GDSL esterase/lipase At1g31550-like n=1 Tax=Bidens hawaiensis TaxID=980011 RepID=UPI004049ACBB
MGTCSTSKFFACFLVVLWSGRLHYANACYSSIISFGDSIADTGNRKHLALASNKYFSCDSPPYGQNFVGQPTGRCSNGRLIIDFLADSLGLRLMPPYLNIKERSGVATLRQGVNYAVAGTTAMNSTFVEEQWYGSVVFNRTGCLRVQLEWFKQSLPFICGSTTSDCKNFIGNSLILVGEIGGNDYNIPLSLGKHIDEIQPYVPLVIDTIISVVNELIEMGAQTLVVPGNFPIGCFPSHLTVGESGVYGEHDPITGCLTKLNQFSEYHNKMLQTKLNQIRELNPNVNVIYADYYNAAMQIYISPDEYGFTNGTLKACCGSEGPYNYNASATCGNVSTILCDEPDAYVSWDGMHLTEAAYKVIFKSLFQGPYTTPEFYSLCPITSTSQAAVRLSSSI